MSQGLDTSYTSDDHSFRGNDPYARAKYDLTLRWLTPVIAPNDLIYNIGVGSGYFNHLASANGLRVIGCEPDDAVFRAASASAPAGVTVVNATLEGFAAGRERAKFIVMHDVLEHIEDDATATDHLHDLVTPDGRLILSVPALPALYGLHDEKLGHYRRYTESSLRRVLERRFVVRRFRWYGMASIPIALWFSRWKRIPYPVGEAGQRSLLHEAYGAVCAIEGRLPEPIGTSIIVEVEPR
jgi:SAM-dependent methyltransferase